MTATRRLVVSVLMLASLVGALATGRQVFFSLAYFWGGLLALSLLWALAGLHGVRLSRHTRARRAQVGRPFEERFVLRNAGWLPKLWLEVRDLSNLPGHYASTVVEGLGGRQERAWVVRTLCRYRGKWTLGPMTLSAGDPFGLFQISRQLPQTGSLVVFPAALSLADFALPVGLLPGGEFVRRRTHAITPNAATVREFAHGDSLSRIHWKSTARRGRLMVKEFELDPLADIWIFLDAERGAHAAQPHASPSDEAGEVPFWLKGSSKLELPPDTEEYCVTAAATLAQHLIRRGRAVGLAAYGQTREVIQADRGERQLTKLLETMAVLRAQGALRIDQLLLVEGAQLPRGATIIVVTASPDGRWPAVARTLQQRGLRLAAALIDPDTFGGVRGMPFTLSMLQAAAIPASVIRRGDDIAAALAPAVPAAAPKA